MPVRSRWKFALVVVGLVYIVGLLSIWVPSAVPVFDHLMPALLLVLGYCFGRVR